MLSYRKLAMRVLGRPLNTGGGIYSPRPVSQRAAAFILTAIMLTSLTAPAFAGTWYIENGDITVKASGTEGKNKVSQGANQEVEDTDTIITNRDKDTASSNTVTIDAGNDKVEVTLEDVNIKADSGFALTSNGDVTLTLKGDNSLTGGISGNGISSSGSLTISGGEKDSLTAQGGSGLSGIFSSGGVTISGGTVNATGGSSGSDSGDGIHSGSLTISGGTVNAKGGNSGTGDYSNGGSGIRTFSSGGVTISGGTVNAAGGDSGNGNHSAGGSGIYNGGRSGSITISGGTVDAKGGNSGTGDYSNGGSGICNGGRSGSITISGGTVNAAGGNDGNGNYSYGGSGIHSVSGSIDLSGSLELTAKAGKGNHSNGMALSQNGYELDLDAIKDKLDPGAKVTATDADGNVIKEVTGSVKPKPPVTPVEPEGPVIPEESSSSSGGGSAAPSAPASPLPGLTVTDKDGQRISYTSTQSGNTLTVCVGRLTASFRISPAALRQLRAEGIETITFQTILCSTTLSLDELLAMGGEDAEIVLTHHIRSSTLTVSGRAV